MGDCVGRHDLQTLLNCSKLCIFYKLQRGISYGRVEKESTWPWQGTWIVPHSCGQYRQKWFIMLMHFLAASSLRLKHLKWTSHDCLSKNSYFKCNILNFRLGLHVTEFQVRPSAFNSVHVLFLADRRWNQLILVIGEEFLYILPSLNLLLLLAISFSGDLHWNYQCHSFCDSKIIINLTYKNIKLIRNASICFLVPCNENRFMEHGISQSAEHCHYIVNMLARKPVLFIKVVD
jgi:hypothetical protein